VTGKGPWWEQRTLEGAEAYSAWERIANPAVYQARAGFVGKAYDVGGEAEVSRRVLTMVRLFKNLSRQYAMQAGARVAPAVPVIAGA